MNQTQTTLCRLVLAAVAVLAHGRLWAGDVTVVGYSGLAPTAQSATPPASNAATPALINPQYGQNVASESPCRNGQAPCENGDVPADGTLRQVNFECPTESSWYGRIDYYHFGQQDIGGANTFNEDGILYTVGYSRRIGPEKFRIELFSGNADYFQRGIDINEADSTTINFGVRAEAEYHWALTTVGQPPLEFFGGIGTRAWIRDLKDTTAFDGTDLWGSQETWWTVYPYIGLEKKWLYDNGFETFVSGRIGFTMFTYEHASTSGSPAFNPKLNVLGQLEAGVRRNALSLSAYLDAMTWDRSGDVWVGGTPYYYPASQLVTIGVKLGFTY
ncbi:MAG: hypothetical protein ABFC63_10215 [Thermoguttaceae bacterium]